MKRLNKASTLKVLLVFVITFSFSGYSAAQKLSDHESWRTQFKGDSTSVSYLFTFHSDGTVYVLPFNNGHVGFVVLSGTYTQADGILKMNLTDGVKVNCPIVYINDNKVRIGEKEPFLYLAVLFSDEDTFDKDYAKAKSGK